jgi:hypothetical protein
MLPGAPASHLQCPVAQQQQQRLWSCDEAQQAEAGRGGRRGFGRRPLLWTR